MAVAIAFDEVFRQSPATGGWSLLGAGSPEGGDIPEDLGFDLDFEPGAWPQPPQN